jgi:hypothetical protein
MPQPGTSTEEPAFARGCSLVSLSQTCLGAGLAQASFTFSVLPEAPKSRTIEALPPSLGLKAATTTLPDDTLSRGFAGVGPEAGATSSGCEQATPNLPLDALLASGSMA